MSTFLHFLKNRDSHGTPVALNFKGNETHRTWLGAFLTIVTNLIVLTYAGIKANILVNKNDPEAIQYDVQRHLEERGNYNLFDHRYNLAFSVFDFKGETEKE